MRKLQTIIFYIVLAALFSCSDQYGPTENEAYAGTWIGASDLGIDEVIEMTDTTCESFVRYQGLNGYVPAWKGFIHKESDTRMFIVTTQIYQLENYTVDSATGQILPESSKGDYVSFDEVDSNFSPWVYRATYDYVVSAETLVFDGVFLYAKTSPVSDNLLD